MGWFSKKSEIKYPFMEAYGRCEFEINGESYKTQNLRKLFKQFNVKPGDYYVLTALLQTDPGNPYDKNAVEVFIENLSVGYIPKTKAKKLATLLENGPGKGYAQVGALIKYAEDAIGLSTVRLDMNWPPKLLSDSK